MMTRIKQLLRAPQFLLFAVPDYFQNIFYFFIFLFSYKGNCVISPSARLVDTKLGNRVLIGGGVMCTHVEIGNDTFITGSERGSTSTYLRRTKIGSYCSIGHNVEVLDTNHHMDFVTTYPFYSTITSDYFNAVDDHIHRSTIIMNDVWIGANVIILGGITIGNGAVVGAGSIVTKDVPDYAVVAGNPAKIIRMRFDAESISSLLKIRWWDWSEEKIKENHSLLMSGDVKTFLRKAISSK